MIIKTQEDVTPKVLDAYKNIDDPRVREIVASLVKHLHAFARDVHLTEEEFEKAAQIIAALGQMTNATHNEVVLMSGSLGFSALVCLLNNGNNGQTETTANLLGPFWRMNSPRTRERRHRSCARRRRGRRSSSTAGSRTSKGKPIEGAEVDVWHSSPEGFYEQQDPEAGRHEPARQVHDRRATVISGSAASSRPAIRSRSTDRWATWCAPAGGTISGRRICTS